MFPLSDENPMLRTPVMTWALLAVMFGVWILVQGGGFDTYQLAATICKFGLVPGELTHQAAVGTAVPLGPGLACVIDNSSANLLTPFTSIFLHGGWMHILGNAIFFWVFGKSIEDSMGSGRYLVFFLVCGLTAAASHVLMEPSSPVPTVGASGAISGIMGAYLVLYPKVRVHMLFWIIFIIRVIPIPAWIVLVWWFVVQVLTGLPQLSQVSPDVSGGVAVWAHVGGFITGVVLIRLFERPELVRQRNALREARMWR